MPVPPQFIREMTGWRTALRDLLPNWSSNRPGKNVGFKTKWSIASTLDIALEILLQGINAWGPGSPNATRTSLPYHAQTRGLIQGEAETYDAYTARLRSWIGPFPYTADIWSNMGKTELLAQAIQTFLSNNPVVRVIERIYSTSGSTSAQWVTANTDGTTSLVTAAWDWDSISGWTDPTTTYTGATTRGFWSDLWIVVEPPTWSVTGGTGRGQAVSLAERDAILSLLDQYKGPHCFCRAIIWSYDTTKFTPTNPTADGNYGNWGKPDGSGNTIAARDPSARYWIPPNG
ncbi:MAG TPA: hypothetical protein VM690_06230 [Gaiellaceae bacterium]|nr:hypothetical protein [Gaiellaceae bacterium]